LTYPVKFSDEAVGDLKDLPEREVQLAALRVARDLGENPHLGEPLRNRLRIGDLSQCRAVRFDRSGWRAKPRYRLVYYNDPDDGSIAVVRVIAVGLRAQLQAYKEAAARVRRERRDRLSG
jgi:mRNA-degrading endonuclease RelE of RelBE toxin-antitoxin system